MPLTAGIENLQRLVARLRREGQAAAADLVASMRDLEREALDTAMGELALRCRASAEQIERLAEGTPTHLLQAEAVLDHVTQLLEYAGACESKAGTGHEPGGGPQPPMGAPAGEADAGGPVEEARHFDETVGMFVTHAMGVVAALEHDVLGAEMAPGASEVEGIRRVLHTLKEEFGVLDMPGPQRLCHQAESTIDACIEQRREFPAECLLQCVDLLKVHLERLAIDAAAVFPDVAPLLDALHRAAHEPADPLAQLPFASSGRAPVRLVVGGEFAASLPEFIGEARSHLVEIEAALVALSGDVGDAERVSQCFRSFHTIKGVAGFLNLTPIVELAHASETLLGAVRTGRVGLGSAEVDLVLECCDFTQRMLQALHGMPAPLQGELRSLLHRLQAAAEAPRAGKDIAAPSASAPNAPATPEATESTPAATTRPAMPTAASVPPPKQAGDAVHVQKPLRGERTQRVGTTRLDSLVDIVGELAIAQSMLVHDPVGCAGDDSEFARGLAQVGKITRDLHEGALALRMVTVRPTFQKMARLVRDLAGKTGKKVVLSVAGEDSELDRSVVEQIADPLMHLIRNAIDHGVEPAAERVGLGKPAEGRLALRAYQQGGGLVIEVEDDGRGIDPAKIVRKAIELGLLPVSTCPSNLPETTVFDLLFRAGFSTAEQVSDLSGRGVGMDVVRRNIEALRGKVEVESRPGRGATFRLRLPLTLALIDGMVVRVGDERYIVPVRCIERSVRPAPSELHRIGECNECVCVRDEVLPIHRLENLLGRGETPADLTHGILLVVEIAGERCCLFVDDLLGQQQVVSKRVDLPSGPVLGVAGGAILGDGRVALILDIATLLETAARA